MDNLSSAEKLLERIRKLLALSGSPNEHEAASAAEKAQALLAENNLSMADLPGGAEDGIFLDGSLLTPPILWQRVIRQGAAHLCFCEYGFATDGGNDRHLYFGEPHNLKVAILMSDYLIEAVHREMKKGLSRTPRAEQERYKTAFGNAAAVRLARRIEARIAGTKKTGIHEGGTNLPALRDLYETTQDRIKQFMKDNMETPTEREIAVVARHKQGLVDGAAAGDAISLDQQVGSGHARRVLGSN